MINILIVTHGALAEGFKNSAEMFFGDDTEKITALGLYPGDTIETLQDKIETAIREKYTDDGMMIFVDMLMGSPFNMATLAMRKLTEEGFKLQCFTGINMPVLMEVMAGTEYMTLDEMTETVENVCHESFVNVRKMMGF